MSTINIKPLHDRVLIRVSNQEQKTASGIIIPDSAQEKPIKGEIVAAGPGIRGDNNQVMPLAVKAGDKVLFGKWGGTEIEYKGEKLLIMKESDIFAIINE